VRRAVLRDCCELRRLLHPDDLVAPGADADEHDRHLQRVGDERQVVASGLRQVGG
jgi:hypothetical protein